MRGVVDQSAELIAGYLPNILAALVILILGWIIASVISSLVRGALRRTTLDNRLAQWVSGGDPRRAIGIEDGISKAVFYLLMLFVLIGFFQALRLTVITQPLNQLLSQLFLFAPRLVGAAVLLLIAWILATVLKMLVTGVLHGLGIDRRLGGLIAPEVETPTTYGPRSAGTDDADSPTGYEGETAASEATLPQPSATARGSNPPVSQTLGDVVYWLVFLLFLPAILSTLALEGMLEPVQLMLNRVLGFLPNIFAAGLIMLVGWFVARVVQRIVTNLLVAVGVDQLSQRVGLAATLGQQQLSALLGLIVYIFILVPAMIAALNALELEAITQPAANMLNTFLGAIPNIFAAAVVLIIAFVVGRVVAGLVANLLAGMGFNAIPARLGLGREATPGEQTPADAAGNLVLVAIVLFASIEAVRLLGFLVLAELLTQFTVLAGQILLGLIIFGIGLYIANRVSGAVLSSRASQARTLALLARVAILVLAGAMALRQMGLANEIVNVAFGLLLGAVAVAAALAFGLGGRDIAARELERWVQSRKEQSAAPAPEPPLRRSRRV